MDFKSVSNIECGIVKAAVGIMGERITPGVAMGIR